MSPRPPGGLSRVALAAVATALVLTSGAAHAAPSTQDPVGGPLLAERGVVVRPEAGATAMPRIKAKAWVLADLTTGEVLAAKNAHLRLPPASTLKTLTALTLLPRLDPGQVYRARRSDVLAEGSHVGIVTGGTYTVHDLFNGLFLPSGNDAASALAHANGGWRRTLRQMNAEAERIQAHDTVAKNPSGLDEPGQVSSPYDLALIARAGLARKDFRGYTTTVSADFPGLMPKKPGKKRSTFRIYTQNRLLLHGYPGAIGVKTGYTTNAGRTFVGAARRHGHTLVVALMRITDWSEVAAMKALDWGFANLGRLEPVGTLVEPLSPETAVPATAPDTAAAEDVAPVAQRGSAAAGRTTTGPVALGLAALGLLLLVGAGVGLARRRGTRSGRAAPRHASGPA